MIPRTLPRGRVAGSVVSRFARPRPAPAEGHARICCTIVAFARPGIVVDSSPVRAQRAKRPLCPVTATAPFSIPHERAARPRTSFRTNSPSPKSRRSGENDNHTT